MARIDTSEYVEYGEEYTEAELAELMILPSQTRNPAFGIYPWLFDEQSVKRAPVFANRTVNFLKDTNDPELRKMYCAIHNMAFRLGSVFGLSYSMSNTSSESLLRKLNTAIREGKFSDLTDSVLEVSQPTLQRFLHPSTYQAVQEYATKKSAMTRE